MYCTKCKSEYVDGYTVCPSCNEPLVETYVMVKEVVEAIDPILLKSVSNEIEAELIMNLLKNNKIACFRKSKGIGSYMNVYMGYSIYGEDVFVDKRDYKRANALLEEVLVSDESEIDPFYWDEFTGNEDESLDQEGISFPFFTRTFMARIIIVLTILGVILSFVMNHLF